MGMVIRGGATSGLSPELKKVATQVGLRKDELLETKQAFRDASVSAPRGLNRLVNAFDVYDADDNGVLNLEELEKFSKELKLDVLDNPFGIFGDEKGLRLKQIEVLRDVADDRGLNKEHLDRLIESFLEYDKDENGRLEQAELQRFTKDAKLPDAGKRGKDQKTSQQFVMAAVDRYLKASDTTLGLVGGSVLEPA